MSPVPVVIVDPEPSGCLVTLGILIAVILSLAVFSDGCESKEAREYRTKTQRVEQSQATESAKRQAEVQRTKAEEAVKWINEIDPAKAPKLHRVASASMDTRVRFLPEDAIAFASELAEHHFTGWECITTEKNIQIVDDFYRVEFRLKEPGTKESQKTSYIDVPQLSTAGSILHHIGLIISNTRS
jgi:hypothetical protein